MLFEPKSVKFGYWNPPNFKKIDAKGTAKAKLPPRLSKSTDFIEIQRVLGLQIGAENHENSLRKRGRTNNSVWKRISMVFGTFWTSNIDRKTPQLEEGQFYEKPCFSLVKSMIFSFWPLRKSLVLQPETRT